jgi:hypothetical protein
LSLLAAPAKVRAVKFLRLAILALVAIAIGGCVTAPLGRSSIRQPYYKVRVTDPQSYLVSEWIAEGQVPRHRDGYRFKAVERVSAPPFSIRSKYPQGRTVYVVGPHIVVQPTGKPYWLYELDGF